MISLRQHNLRVPQDIAVITFDNHPFSMLTEPQLTAIEADMFDIGQKAARFILRKIKKAGTADTDLLHHSKAG